VDGRCGCGAVQASGRAASWQAEQATQHSGCTGGLALTWRRSGGAPSCRQAVRQTDGLHARHKTAMLAAAALLPQRSLQIGSPRLWVKQRTTHSNPDSLSNQPDAGIRAGSQRGAAHAECRAQQSLVRPLGCTAEQPGRLRNQQHTRQAGATAGGGQPAEGFAQQQPAEQGGEGGAQIEDDWRGRGRERERGR